MTDQVFEKGWVVQLKSGGPRMTVYEYAEGHVGGMMVYCQWFNSDKPPFKVVNEVFEPTSLKVISKD